MPSTRANHRQNIAAGLQKSEPPIGCRKCPRLAKYRRQLAMEHPDWWNAPVPLFGDPSARLMLVGLAPGRLGAHRTGRAFTGDASGDFLFAALARAGLSSGDYAGYADDGVDLRDTAIVNAVRCLPPQNKPTGAELAQCARYFTKTLRAMEQLTTMLAIGRVAHEAVIRHYDLRQRDFVFAHGAQHQLPDGRRLYDSYHCSQYNVHTGRLTAQMFDDVLRQAASQL